MLSKSQLIVYGAGCCRLKLIPAYTAVNQHADHLRGNAGGLNRLFAGQCCAFIHMISRIPISAFANTGNHFKLAFLKMERLIKRLQTSFDIIGSQHIWSQFIADAVQINRIKFHNDFTKRMPNCFIS